MHTRMSSGWPAYLVSTQKMQKSSFTFMDQLILTATLQSQTLVCPYHCLLARVSPDTAIGHTYTIAQKKCRELTKKLISRYSLSCFFNFTLSCQIGCLNWDPMIIIGYKVFPISLNPNEIPTPNIHHFNSY